MRPGLIQIGSIHITLHNQSWAFAVFFGFLKVENTHFFHPVTYLCTSFILQAHPQSF